MPYDSLTYCKKIQARLLVSPEVNASIAHNQISHRSFFWIMERRGRLPPGHLTSPVKMNEEEESLRKRDFPFSEKEDLEVNLFLPYDPNERLVFLFPAGS